MPGVDLKNYFLGKLKHLLGFINRANSFRLEIASYIKNPLLLTDSEFIGFIKIENNSTIIKSKLSGNINAGENIKIADSSINGNVTIGNNVKIIDGVVLHGEINVGNFTSINGPNTDMKSVLNKITIGNFCSIARGVTFQEYNHDYSRLTSYFFKINIEGKTFKDDAISKGPILVGHDVWIGAQSIILSGSSIGTGSVIAANSVVSGDIPPYSIAAGSPAKVIKMRFEKEIADELLQSEWWNKPIEEIKNIYTNFSPNKLK